MSSGVPFRMCSTSIFDRKVALDIAALPDGREHVTICDRLDVARREVTTGHDPLVAVLRVDLAQVLRVGRAQAHERLRVRMCRSELLPCLVVHDGVDLDIERTAGGHPGSSVRKTLYHAVATLDEDIQLRSAGAHDDLTRGGGAAGRVRDESSRLAPRRDRVLTDVRCLDVGRRDVERHDGMTIRDELVQGCRHGLARDGRGHPVRTCGEQVLDILELCLSVKAFRARDQQVDAQVIGRILGGRDDELVVGVALHMDHETDLETRSRRCRR